ncbi:MAG TPA: hypothetical protein VGS62_00095 [Streptosporangiaceae bacterium]|nr:hypothetical protein [Streptosporangiaceae bacterium]
MERDTLSPFGPRHARPTVPTLDELRWEFHGWECWKGISGLYYARPHGAPRSVVQVEDLLDLRDEIVRWIWRNEHERQARDT